MDINNTLECRYQRLVYYAIITLSPMLKHVLRNLPLAQCIFREAVLLLIQLYCLALCTTNNTLGMELF
jgi:hypothetical protein